MRALIWGVMLAGVLWCGWWWIAATGLDRGTDAWFKAQTDAGRIATRSGQVVHGFPSRLDLTVDNPVLGDPATGYGWSAPFVQVFALTYKPWHLIAAFAPEQTVSLPDGSSLRVTADKLMASLIVKPGPALTLDRSTLTGDGLRVDRAGIAVDIESLRFGTRQGAAAHSHDLALELIGVTPGALPPETGLAARIDVLRLETDLTFDAPLDRHSATTRPNLIAVNLREARVNWGDLVVHGAGRVAPDATGRAEGRIDIRIENWRLALKAAVAAGLITPDVAPTWAKGLDLLEKAGNAPEGQLSLPLILGNGRMSLGPLPLGPAPLLTIGD
ncbi:MAG: DUF2125 domain-containing protein [Gemmobacter sp.]|nr:DUF2125 domain-containing protein [Gemmobacter sp.]